MISAVGDAVTDLLIVDTPTVATPRSVNARHYNTTIMTFIEIKLTNATRYTHQTSCHAGQQASLFAQLINKDILHNRTQSFGTQAFNTTKHIIM